MKLDDRKITILKAIIRSYLDSGEPVGSRTLSKLPDLSVSSATIRNEMSDLEELGYIVQPHTSAGRIPTDMGYRFYVDEILREKNTEIAEYKDLMIKRVDRLEKVLTQLAETLAANTNYATMVSGPNINKNKIKFIQLSGMEKTKILIATVFEGNIINNKIISTPQELPLREMTELNMLLNTTLTGLTMNEISLPTIMKLRTDSGKYGGVIDQILKEISEAFSDVEEEFQVYTSGATNIFKYPELTGGGSASLLIDRFEKKDELRTMLNDINEQESDEGIRVYIGDELPMGNMHDCSLVTANYDFGGGASGTVGIVGPKRMDYDKVLGILRTVMKQLEEQYRKETG